MRPHTPALLLAALVVVVDQATKAWARATPLGEVHSEPLGGLLTLRHAANTGGVLGSFAGSAWGLLALSVPAMALVAWLLARAASDARAQRLGLAVLLGGMVANAIDRLRLGHVTDWLQVGGPALQTVLDRLPLASWPVFNLADLAIVGGLAVYLVAFVTEGDASV